MGQPSPQINTSAKSPSMMASVWSIAGPSIGVFLMATIAGVLIIKIVSGLGTPAVAAVTAGQRINFVLVAMLMGLGAATTALVSRAWGAKDPELATAYARLGLVSGVIIALIIAAFSAFFAPQISEFFKLDDVSAPLAVSYIRWMSLFAVSQSILMVLSTACRSIGDAKTPLYLGLFGHSSSVFLAWALTYGKLGLPAMGIQGAAIGWGVAFSLCAFAYLALWMNNRLRLGFSLSAQAPKADLSRFIRVCMPATIEQFMMQAAMLVFVWFVARHGTEAFAAYGIGISLLSVTIVIGMGFSIAAASLVGQSLGAGDREGAIESGYSALRLALVTMTILGALTSFFSTELARLLVDDPEVVRLTALFVLILGLAQPILAIDLVLGGAMRGAGDTRFPLFAGLISAVFIRLTLAGIATWLELPVQWIYSVFMADQLVKSTIIVWRYRGLRWLRAL